MEMEKKSKYFRDLAWAQLSDKWGQVVIFTLVYLVIAYVVSSLAAISGIFLLPMGYSYIVAFLDNKRSSGNFKTESLFDGYKDFLRIFGTAVLVDVYIFLWTLLFVVPGIIKYISYSQTYFILKDNPELDFNSAIERSMDMMQGHKWQYFKLHFSFFGWFLLCIITCGILILWVQPYLVQTLVNFYESVKEDYEKRITT